MAADRILLAVVAACAVGIVALVLAELGGGRGPETEMTPVAGGSVLSNDLADAASASSTAERRPGRPADWSGESTEDFHRHCPGFDKAIARRGVRGGFTPLCEMRLDQRFLDEVPLLTPLTAEHNTLTWRHVFDDPLRKRQLVIETLANPACRVAVGETRHDLADRCNADALADYAVLKYKCASGLYRIGRRIDRGIAYPLFFDLRDRLFDSDSYWRKRWGVENAYFRHAWIAAKCAGVPPRALASLGAFDDSMEFGGRPRPGEEHWWWAEQGFEAYQLMGVADRLASHLARTGYGYERADISTWQRVQPVMAEVLRVKDPGRYASSSEEKMARLKHAIATSTWARIRRIDIDDSWLYGLVGEFTPEEFERATAEADGMMAKQRADSYYH